MIMNLLLLHFAFNPNIQKTTFTKPIQIDYNVTFPHHPFQIQNARIFNCGVLFLSENLENDLCILDDLLGLVIYTYLNGM